MVRAQAMAPLPLPSRCECPPVKKPAEPKSRALGGTTRLKATAGRQLLEQCEQPFAIELDRLSAQLDE